MKGGKGWWLGEGVRGVKGGQRRWGRFRRHAGGSSLEARSDVHLVSESPQTDSRLVMPRWGRAFSPWDATALTAEQPGRVRDAVVLVIAVDGVCGASLVLLAVPAAVSRVP